MTLLLLEIPVELAGDDETVPQAFQCQEVTQAGLRVTVSIGIGRIDEVHSQLQCLPKRFAPRINWHVSPEAG